MNAETIVAIGEIVEVLENILLEDYGRENIISRSQQHAEIRARIWNLRSELAGLLAHENMRPETA